MVCTRNNLKIDGFTAWGTKISNVQVLADAALRPMDMVNAVPMVPASTQRLRPAASMAVTATTIPNAAKMAAHPKGPNAAVMAPAPSATSAAVTAYAPPRAVSAAGAAASARAARSASFTTAAQRAAQTSAAMNFPAAAVAAAQVGMMTATYQCRSLYQLPLHATRQFRHSTLRITHPFLP